jgi:hypothetical protein
MHREKCLSCKRVAQALYFGIGKSVYQIHKESEQVTAKARLGQSTSDDAKMRLKSKSDRQP